MINRMLVYSTQSGYVSVYHIISVLYCLVPGVTDKNYDRVIDEWLTEAWNSDDDLEIDDDNCPLPSVQERNAAATEPAYDSDLTQFEAEVLQREDDANDQAIRSIVPDDCYTFAWSKDRKDFSWTT